LSKVGDRERRGREREERGEEVEEADLPFSP